MLGAETRDPATGAEAVGLVPGRWHRLFPAVFAACAVVVVVLALLVARTDGPLAFDRSVDARLYRLYPSLSTDAFWITNLDHPARFAAVMVVLVALCLATGSLRAVVALVVSVVGTLAATDVAKQVVERVKVAGLSAFPSGHAAVAAAVATVVVLLAARGGRLRARGVPPAVCLILTVAAWAAVVVVGLAVMILEEHRLSDVIAGAALGGGSAYLVSVAVDRLWPRRRRS